MKGRPIMNNKVAFNKRPSLTKKQLEILDSDDKYKYGKFADTCPNKEQIKKAKSKIINRNSKFKQVGLSENNNPDYSLTFLRTDKVYGDVYSLFNEKLDVEIGWVSADRLRAKGFSDFQLKVVKNDGGTLNFVSKNKQKEPTVNKTKWVSLGKDNWGRKTYKNKKTGQVIKNVDGVLTSTSKDGEPDSPLINQNV